MLEPITINELLLLGNVTFVMEPRRSKGLLEMMRLHNGNIQWWDVQTEKWFNYGSHEQPIYMLELHAHKIYLYLPEDE